MLKSLKLIIFGLLSYLVFMLVLAPASFWLRWVELPPAVQLGQVSGSIWQGEISQLRYQQLSFDRVRWQLNGWALWRGQLKLQLHSGSLQQTALPYVQANISYGLSGMTLKDSLLRLPVNTIVPLLQLPLPVAAAGELVVDIQRFAQQGKGCAELQGAASWNNAQLQPPTGTWLQLEAIHARLSCQQGQPLLVTDPANPLGLAIDATVNTAGVLSVDGTLKPAANLPAEVHQAMQFVGQPDANGRYRIRF